MQNKTQHPRKRLDRAYRVALMHYQQGETMETIARQLGLSRSTVSRLLVLARDAGLVQFVLHSPEESTDSMGAELRRRFNVSSDIVPTGNLPEHRRLDAVAVTAGKLISEEVADGMTLGVAWGSTVSALATHLVPQFTRGVSVVQLHGSANPVTTGIPYAGGILQMFGDEFRASVHFFPVPAFFDRASTRDAMFAERSLVALRNMQQASDIAVFGVGAFTYPIVSHVYAGGYVDAAMEQALRCDGVVGDVCTVLLRADGSYADIELNRRASGIRPDELAIITKRFCVAYGAAKALPVLAALRAGTVTHLVMDEPSVALLLNLDAQFRGGPAVKEPRAVASMKNMAL